MRDGMTSTHTLPPPREEGSGAAATGSRDRSLRDEGEEVETMSSSALVRIRRREGSQCMTSFIVPKTEGEAEVAVPPALMKPIMITQRDRSAEETTSALLRESTEDWLNLLHSRLNGADSCTVAFLGQTAHGPAITGSTSSNVAPQTRGVGGSGGRHSGSMDNTWAMNSAMCMLRLQRIGRGYLTRRQLAQRFREVAEENDLDAMLQDVLWQAAPVPPSATGLAAAAAAASTASPTEERTAAAMAGPPSLPAAKGTSSPTASTPRPAAGTAASTAARAPARNSSSSSAVQIGRVLSPFLLPEDGDVPSTQSSGSVYGGDGAAIESSPRHPSATITSSGSASRFTADAPTAAASEQNSRRAREHSPFVTPDNSRYLMSPAFLPPSAYNGGQRASFSQDYAASNSLSLSREAAGAASGVLAMPGPVFGSGPEVVSAATGAGGGAEPPSLPTSTSRRHGPVSPPSLRVSFSRDALSPLGKHDEADAETSGSALAVFPASAAAAEVGGNGSSSSSSGATRTKLVEGVSGVFLARRGGSLSASHSDSYGAMAAAATVTASHPVLLPAATATSADEVVGVRSELGEMVEEDEEEEEMVGTPAGAIPRWKATSAAAGASNSPLEGSIFAVSGRSGRSMISASSLPFEFSTTAHAVSAISHGELMFSGRTMGSITPAQWALDEVALVDSSSHFDDGESVSEDNDERCGNNSSGDSDEEGEEAQHSSDEDADEADAFRKDITHVEGLEPACFGAAAHLLRGDGAALTKDGALALLQRVGRGYLCRRHEHFLFMVSISFAEVALLQRVAVAFRTRKAMGLEFHVNRLVREEMSRWDLRNRAAIKLHAVVRGFMARQRVKRLQRKLFTRLELRTALELPDPDE